MSWAAVVAAAQHAVVPRVPLVLADGSAVGRVARAHLPALAAWPEVLGVGAAAVVLHAPQRLAGIEPALRDAGLIPGWRDEPFTLWASDGRALGVIERAAARLWGSRTWGAHLNGYVADASGRPTHLWVARRAQNKPTDPGKLDNLVGGGVAHGQTPAGALVREAAEEAGLTPHACAAMTPGSVLALACDVPEGFQDEWLYTYDLRLPATWRAHNPDGEVAEQRLLPVGEVLALAEGGAMTRDAALVTLDFAQRHGLVNAYARPVVPSR